MSPNPDPSPSEGLPGLWEMYRQHLRGATYTDLSHAFFPGQPRFPAFPDQTFSNFVSLSEGALFEVHQYGFVGQWGTHVDPPSHMVAGGRTISELGVKEMLLPLCVFNISEQVRADPDYRPSLADLEAWEAVNGRVPEGSFVALRSDWHQRWPDRERMANADAGGIAHFPGWSLEVLQTLLEERGVVAVGHEPTAASPAPETAITAWKPTFWAAIAGNWSCSPIWTKCLQLAHCYWQAGPIRGAAPASRRGRWRSPHEH